MIRTILLVEDDRGSAFLFKSVLQRNGYAVLVAGNGLEALQLISKNTVDLVITDVVMPKMDGVDLYDELKKRESTQHIPVIIITDKDVFKEAFSALGVEHFISKTTEMNILLDKIKNISNNERKQGFLKILISGTNRTVLDHMQRMLVTKGHLVSTVDNTVDTLQKAFVMVPHLLLVDLRMSDMAQTKELIRSLRCYQFFHKTKIVTYVYLQPAELAQGMAHWQIIEDEATTCKELGADKFIGNFSQVTFLDQIKEYL